MKFKISNDKKVYGLEETTAYSDFSNSLPGFGSRQVVPHPWLVCAGTIR